MKPKLIIILLILFLLYCSTSSPYSVTNVSQLFPTSDEYNAVFYTKPFHYSWNHNHSVQITNTITNTTQMIQIPTDGPMQQTKQGILIDHNGYFVIGSWGDANPIRPTICWYTVQGNPILKYTTTFPVTSAFQGYLTSLTQSKYDRSYLTMVQGRNGYFIARIMVPGALPSLVNISPIQPNQSFDSQNNPFIFETANGDLYILNTNFINCYKKSQNTLLSVNSNGTFVGTRTAPFTFGSVTAACMDGQSHIFILDSGRYIKKIGFDTSSSLITDFMASLYSTIATEDGINFYLTKPSGQLDHFSP